MSQNEKRLQKLRLVRDRVIADSTVVSKLDGSQHRIFPVAITMSEGTALRDWIFKEGATRTIEIGLAYGVSALFACEGLLMSGKEGMKHVTIDPFQKTGYKDCGLQLLEETGVLDIIEHHCEESQLLLPRFVSEGHTFDFAFIDGSHFFENVFLDAIYLGRLVGQGNIIFVDDYQLPAIARAVSFCTSNLGWQIEEISEPDENHQWAVLRTAREPKVRTFRDFVEF